MEAVRNLVLKNGDFLEKAVENSINDEESVEEIENEAERIQYFENLKSGLRQMVRDWSEEGIVERNSSYGPILEYLKQVNPENKTVLVPGAGLGRLCYEIAKLGFEVQGNEFSYIMLLLSDFMLNGTKFVNEHVIYPYATQFSNNWNVRDQLRGVKVPDELPAIDGNLMSMVAGGFEQVYGQDCCKWDIVISCFFLDTAQNVVSYLRLIHKILKVGGKFVNNGPLTWHFEETKELSVEISIEELFEIAEAVGFKLEIVSQNESSYAQNALSMHWTVYKCCFFVMTKLEK